jgi:cytochrome c biogenesis protein CcdA
MNKHSILVIICLILLLPTVASAEPTVIEYFYHPDCHGCDQVEPLVKNVSEQYDDVIFLKVNVGTPDGFDDWNVYDFVDLPSVVVNGRIPIDRYRINDSNLHLAIEMCNTGGYDERPDVIPENVTNTTKTNEDEITASMAYTLGLLAGISPCLMAILGFLLSFTSETSISTRDGLKRACIFGSGLMVAYLVLGLTLILFGRSIPDVQLFSVVVGIIIFCIGLYLLGIVKIPISTNAMFRRLSRKCINTVFGIFLLGMLFSVVKVPCSMPMLLVLLDNIVNSTTVYSITMLLVFIGGILTPFLGIGIVGGYTVTKSIQKYGFHMNVFNGLVLVIFGLWMVLNGWSYI